MQRVELGNTGQTVSQVGLGCMLMGTSTDEETSFRILDQYLDAGGDFLDTANCYAWWSSRDSLGGESEALLGRWFSHTGRRDEVFLATKGTALPADPPALWAGRDEPDWGRMFSSFEGAGAEVLRRNLEDSLRRLQTDHVDLYYVHVDDYTTPLEESLEALSALVAEGKTRYIGWSNVRAWRLERIRQLCARYGWHAPVAVQMQHSYLRCRPGHQDPFAVGDEMLHYLRHHDDLTLVAYSPLLKGAYDDPVKRAEHHVMRPYHGPDTDARLATVKEIAGEVGATPGQVALAWLLHQTSPTAAALVGPRTLAQYEAAMPALQVRLTAEQLGRLDDAGA